VERAKTIAWIAGSYLVLLIAIFTLGMVVYRQRRRTPCLPLPEVPSGVRQQVADIASRATDVSSEVGAFAARAAAEAKTIAERAAKILS
jgi:hypothetical protein